MAFDDDNHFDIDTSDSDDNLSHKLRRRPKWDVEAIPQPIIFDCILCTRKYNTLKKYVRHLQRHEPPGGFKCQHCDRKFCNQHIRHEHTHEIHQSISCKLCSEVLNNENIYVDQVFEKNNGSNEINSLKSAIIPPSLVDIKHESDPLSDLEQIEKRECKTVRLSLLETRLTKEENRQSDSDHSSKDIKPEIKKIPPENSLIKTHARETRSRTFKLQNDHANVSKTIKPELYKLSSSSESRPTRRKATKRRFRYNERGGLFQSNNEQIDCEFCPRTYLMILPYIKHMIKEHNCEEAEICKKFKIKPKGAKTDIEHICKICGAKYMSATCLQKHATKHGPNGTFIHKCKMCPNYFETLANLYKHVEDDHAEKVNCKLCFRIFPDLQGLQSHMKIKHSTNQARVSKKGVKPFVCHKCGRTFHHRIMLVDHEKSDCDKNPQYRCDICGNCYKSSVVLKNHMLTHAEKKQNICSDCGQTFTTRGQLKVHSRKHTGETPFKCEVCSKAFTYRESLLTHISQHTGVKRFMCGYCGLRFSCISGLQSHRRARKNTCDSQPLTSKPVASVQLNAKRVFTGIKTKDVTEVET